MRIYNLYLLIFSYMISCTIAFIVYKTGGTSKVYANLMYLPIALVASNNGKKQGIIFSIICALLIGPFMPLDIKNNISQVPINWISRLVIYVIIAYIIGFFADFHKKEYENIRNRDLKIVEAQMATIYSLVKLSESRDRYTGDHIEKISSVSKLLAEKLKKTKYSKDVTDEYIDYIYKASPLHDIGKVGIPDSILLKPGKLTEEEFEIMKTHTIKGAETLEAVKRKYPDIKFLEIGINITKYHHEKWDGSGYPYGLIGEEIPLSARIISIADVYEALRSKRVYKDSYSHEKSLDIIKKSSGIHFDPLLVNIFLENENEFKEIYEKSNDVVNWE